MKGEGKWSVVDSGYKSMVNDEWSAVMCLCVYVFVFLIFMLCQMDLHILSWVRERECIPKCTNGCAQTRVNK